MNYKSKIKNSSSRDGYSIGDQGIDTDIAQLKYVNETIKIGEDKYRRFFEEAIEGIFQITPEGMYLSVNPALARIFGYLSPQDMIDSVTNIARQHYVNSKDLKDMMRLLRNHDKIEGFEVEVYRKNRSKFWISVNLRAVRDAKGNILYLEGTNVDITARKNAEIALKEGQEYTKILFYDSIIPQIIMDAETGAYIDCNEAALKIYGYAGREELINKTPLDLSPPIQYNGLDSATQATKRIQTCREKGYHVFEWRHQRPNGEIWDAEVHLKLIKHRARLLMQFTLQDITERKRFAERLSRVDKMEALGTLAGGVAHNLNNVFGILVGFSELLIEKLPENTLLEEWARKIYKSSIKGSEIVKDLLILAGKEVLVAEVVDINRIVSDYIDSPEFKRLKLNHPLVTIRTELDDALLNIIGSPIHLSKTIMNLVSNAVEFIPHQGNVIITTKNCYLDQPICGHDEMREENYVMLAVSDTGMGISNKELSKIFDPFYTKRITEKSGIGLGLAVVWGTVKDLNGHIDVQSQEGKGSTFTLYFPATNEESKK